MSNQQQARQEPRSILMNVKQIPVTMVVGEATYLVSHLLGGGCIYTAHGLNPGTLEQMSGVDEMRRFLANQKDIQSSMDVFKFVFSNTRHLNCRPNEKSYPVYVVQKGPNGWHKISRWLHGIWDDSALGLRPTPA